MGEWLSVVFTIAVIAMLIWAGTRHKNAGPKLATDRTDLPYTVYTRAFDLEVPGHEVALHLSAKGVRGPPPRDTRVISLADRQDAARMAYQDCIGSPAAAELRVQAASMRDASVVLLVDQSGSMANVLPVVAGQLKAVAEILDDAGVENSLLGFTTAGWRGGMAREAWTRAGRPAYPGRLCALLHVIYKDFDAPLSEENWHAWLDPHALYENVDGEASIWACSRQAVRSCENRLLIVISDGAPVDDSTLMENGATFLERHLIATIDGISERANATLGAIGIGYDVDRYYSNSVGVENADALPAALVSLLGKILPNEREPATAPGDR